MAGTAHSGGGEGPGPLPTAEKRRAGDVTPVVHVTGNTGVGVVGLLLEKSVTPYRGQRGVN